jgi:hypothetical protein
VKKLIIIYIVLDVFCTAVGMGIPIFNILLGFGVGWYYSAKVLLNRREKNVLPKLFKVSLLTSFLTFVLMAIIWLPAVSKLFGPFEKIANFGIPMILYEPLASFIGWIILMVFIAPFLQLLVTVFTGNIIFVINSVRKS